MEVFDPARVGPAQLIPSRYSAVPEIYCLFSAYSAAAERPLAGQLLPLTALDPVRRPALSATDCTALLCYAEQDWDALQAPASDATSEAPKAGRGGLMQGFMVGISNPKDIIFFIAFFPQFIQITESFGKSMVVLSLLWVAIDFAVLSLYIFAIGKIASQRSNRLISLASGVALLLIAGGGLLYNLKELAA